jgi:hypothetical protein
VIHPTTNTHTHTRARAQTNTVQNVILWPFKSQPAVTIPTTCRNVKKLCVLHTQCTYLHLLTYLFPVIFTININYYSQQSWWVYERSQFVLRVRKEVNCLIIFYNLFISTGHVPYLSLKFKGHQDKLLR